MQLYLIPRVGSGSHFDPYKPKYSNLLGTYSFKEYGQQPVFMVFTDLTLLQTTTLLATALLNGGDILPYPVDLDTQLTLVDDVLPLFGDAHESRELTADWMAAGMTYRTCARRVMGGLMAVAFKMKIAGESLFAIPFTEALSQYSSDARDAFYQACTDCGLDWSAAGVVNTDTLRAAIAKVLPDCDSVSVSAGGFTV